MHMSNHKANIRKILITQIYYLGIRTLTLKYTKDSVVSIFILPSNAYIDAVEGKPAETNII